MIEVTRNLGELISEDDVISRLDREVHDDFVWVSESTESAKDTHERSEARAWMKRKEGGCYRLLCFSLALSSLWVSLSFSIFSLSLLSASLFFLLASFSIGSFFFSPSSHSSLLFLVLFLFLHFALLSFLILFSLFSDSVLFLSFCFTYLPLWGRESARYTLAVTQWECASAHPLSEKDWNRRRFRERQIWRQLWVLRRRG